MNLSSPTLKRVQKTATCSGCGLCATLSEGAVEMKMSSSGFLRPQQSADIRPEVEALIALTCPGVNLEQSTAQADDHPLWGPIVATRTGASLDPSLRHHASSGGVVSALLLYLLESRTVERIVQIAVSDTSPIENATVVSLDRNDIFRAAGSRYAPSSPLQDLDAQLARPGRFALVGKPCDIAAVRALARHDHRVNQKIPVLLSFFCAGVPSIHGTRRILERLEVAEQNLETFQYRGDGWPGYATAATVDQQIKRMSYADSWGSILSKHVQFRCKICPDGSGGLADIVCGDAWRCDEQGYPLFEEEAGRSLIITRTAVGEDLLQRAIQARYVEAEALDPADIEAMQPSQAHRKRMIVSRLLAMAALGRRPPRYRGFNVVAAALSGGIMANVRSFFGMARRLMAAQH